MRAASLLLLLLLCATAPVGCARPGPTSFSLDNARAHVRTLAGTIGSRPVGTEPNDRAREYIVSQLRGMGFDVRVQTADARRPEAGLTARVHNIVAVREGRRPNAIGLVSHYDSSPHAPGAADDALGVAVSLEAARVLSAGGGMQHALAVVVTDGEEVGLMGAAALDADPIASRLGVYLNHEAVGSGGPTMLFETGPGNAWIVDAWAGSAPMPRGGSFALEVYRRLPNDTDFSILKRLGVPGLNFAPILDGYAYHTPRDTAERLDPRAIEQMGHNSVRIVQSLDAVDLTRRTPDPATYTDLMGRAAISIGPLATAWLTGIALLFGVLAWVRALKASLSTFGVLRFILTFIWSLAGASVVLAFMIGAAVLLRASREVYHPWYAHPARLLVLTGLMGALGGWLVARAGAILPYRLRGRRDPALGWAVALPAWLLMAALAAYHAPTAAYLFLLPLLFSSALLLVTPLSHTWLVRITSVLAFSFNVILWGSLTSQLLFFAVAHFGRQPIITPPWVYAALMFFGAIMIVPPALAAMTGRPLRRPGVATALLLVSVVAAVVAAWIAPAYTHERPQRRFARFVHDTSTGRSIWQVAGSEPGLDLHAPPEGWRIASEIPGLSIPLPRLRYPFMWQREAQDVQPDVPARVTTALGSVTGSNGEFTVSVTPVERGLAAAFIMPEGLHPVRPNLPGIERGARWVARFAALPPEGVAFRAFLPVADLPRLRDLRVLVTRARLPGGTGWQGLPPWLPQDLTVWSAEAVYIVSPLPEVAPPPALAFSSQPLNTRDAQNH